MRPFQQAVTLNTLRNGKPRLASWRCSTSTLKDSLDVLSWTCQIERKRPSIKTGQLTMLDIHLKRPPGRIVLDMPDSEETTQHIDWQAKQPSQVSCVSDDRKCWGTRESTGGHNVKGITQKIAWRREEFQWQHWENLWETGQRAHELSRACTYLSELNWNEKKKLKKKRKESTTWR